MFLFLKNCRKLIEDSFFHLLDRADEGENGKKVVDKGSFTIGTSLLVRSICTDTKDN